MEQKQHILTPKGKIQLETKLKELEEVKRPKIKLDIEEMRNRGDLSENDGYTLALQDYESNEARIAEIEMTLQNSIIEEPKDDGKVGLGETVTVKTPTGEIAYDIVGANEADPMNKKITPESPIGSALMGKKVGDTVKVTLPAGEMEYKIVALS